VEAFTLLQLPTLTLSPLLLQLTIPIHLALSMADIQTPEVERGRTQLQGSERRDATVHTTNFPLPLHPTPHTTQFRFRSTLNRPVITATVTITFFEEMDPLAPLPAHNEELNRATPSNRGVCSPGEQQPNDDRATLHGKALVGNQQAVGSNLGDTQASGSRRGDTSGLHAGTGSIAAVRRTQGGAMSAGVDDWYKYACRVEEESTLDNL